MKAFYVFLLLFLIVKATTVSKPITKNILLFAFPGGKSHVFIFKELIRTTINKQQNSNERYKFHILVHNYDIKLWKNIDVDR